MMNEETKKPIMVKRERMTSIEDKGRGIFLDSNQVIKGLMATATRKAMYTKSKTLLISLKNLIPKKTIRTQKTLDGAMSIVWRDILF